MNLRASYATTGPTGNPTEGSEEEVQSTSKYLVCGGKAPLQHRNT
jgi:hypothetical protein